MSGKTNGERKPLTTKKVRWIGLALWFLIGPLCYNISPTLGGVILIAGFYVTIRAKKIAAKYGAEEAPPVGGGAGQSVSSGLSVKPRYIRQWWEWDSSVHESEGQPSRMQRALTQKIEIVKMPKGCWAQIRGAKGDIYRTSFRICSCPDFRERGKPCKHMYKLAMQCAGFNPVPYIILNDVKPHPLRGFMNLGMFRVKGKNFQTNRMNTKTVYALDQSKAIQAAASEYGLIEPFSAEEVAFPEALENQQMEMAAAGIYVPEGARLYDYEAANWRDRNYDEVTVTREQWEYAASLGILISALAGETEGKELFKSSHKRWKK